MLPLNIIHDGGRFLYERVIDDKLLRMTKTAGNVTASPGVSYP